MRKIIAIKPIGEIDQKILNFLKDALPQKFGLPVEILPSDPVPKSAYNPLRAQYLADEILEHLKSDAIRTLGIIDQDIYTEGLNFIFGEAQIGGSHCLISLTRLRPQFWDEIVSNPEQVFLERVLKEAVHELGHTFGLSHCPEPKCVMHFSNSIKDTDYKNSEFCKRCRDNLDFWMTQILNY